MVKPAEPRMPLVIGLTLTVLWIGLLIGASFLATPAKFLAPSLSRAAALDVGRHTFAIFNKVEWLPAATLFVVLLVRRGTASLLPVCSGRPKSRKWAAGGRDQAAGRPIPAPKPRTAAAVAQSSRFLRVSSFVASGTERRNRISSGRSAGPSAADRTRPGEGNPDRSPGAQTALRILGAGELIGCVAVFQQILYPATATAIEDTTVLAWGTPFFRDDGALSGPYGKRPAHCRQPRKGNGRAGRLDDGKAGRTAHCGGSPAAGETSRTKVDDGVQIVPGYAGRSGGNGRCRLFHDQLRTAGRLEDQQMLVVPVQRCPAFQDFV